jgi:RimJ/RimL family protein N-acetyltransferase
MNMNLDIQIMEASVEDAPDLGEIQTQTWLTSYPNPEAGITREEIEAKVEEWKQQGDARIEAEISKSNAKTWIAKDKGKVIGFIGVSKGEENKIEAFHILPSYQGQGIGTQLLTIALNWLGEDKKVTLTVVTYNNRAQRLYERFGFRKQGEALEDIITLPSGRIVPKTLMVKG